MCALFTRGMSSGWGGMKARLFPPWGHSSAGRAPALQAGGRRFDPDWLHQSLNAAHTNERLKRTGVEAGFAFFDNLGRNKRFGSNESNVSLRQVGEVNELVAV